MRGWVGAKGWLRRWVGGGRQRRVIVFLLAFALVAALAGVFVGRQAGIAALRRDIARLEADRTAAAARQKELRAEVASTTDPKVLEDEIRIRLGLVRPTEEKVFFIEESSP